MTDELVRRCSTLEAENAQLRTELAELATVTVCNTLDCVDECEYAETDFEGLFDAIPPNEVREVWACHSLPNHFAAHVSTDDDPPRIVIRGTHGTPAQLLSLVTQDTQPLPGVSSDSARLDWLEGRGFLRDADGTWRFGICYTNGVLTENLSVRGPDDLRTAINMAMRENP